MNSVLFSRIAGFGGLVKIKTPEDVKEEYREFVTKAYNTLGKKPEDGDLSGQPEQGVNNGRNQC